MNKTYIMTKDELLNFAKKLYSEACHGYMDLCDSVAENMSEEFLKDKQFHHAGDNPSHTNIPFTPHQTGYQVATAATAPSGITWDHFLSTTNAVGYDGMYAGNVVTDPVITTNSPTFRVECPVRNEIFVRTTS